MALTNFDEFLSYYCKRVNEGNKNYEMSFHYEINGSTAIPKIDVEEHNENNGSDVAEKIKCDLIKEITISLINKYGKTDACRDILMTIISGLRSIPNELRVE